MRPGLLIVGFAVIVALGLAALGSRAPTDGEHDVTGERGGGNAEPGRLGNGPAASGAVPVVAIREQSPLVPGPASEQAGLPIAGAEPATLKTLSRRGPVTADPDPYPIEIGTWLDADAPPIAGRPSPERSVDIGAVLDPMRPIPVGEGSEPVAIGPVLDATYPRRRSSVGEEQHVVEIGDPIDAGHDRIWGVDSLIIRGP